MDEKFISIKLSNNTYCCDDVHCKSIQHCQDIDYNYNYLCSSIINYCLESSVLAIPVVRSGNGDIPGWTEQLTLSLRNYFGSSRNLNMLFSTMCWLFCYCFLIILDTTVHHNILNESEDM